MKIKRGKLEIFTSKNDAIDKLRQMRGVCREKYSDDNFMQFYCSKKGKLAISNPPRRHFQFYSPTALFGKIIEEDNKTYITFYTIYSKSFHSVKIFYFVMTVIMVIVSLFVDKTVPVILFILFLFLFLHHLFSATKEGEQASFDSDALITELERRVEAVNNWDK